MTSGDCLAKEIWVCAEMIHQELDRVLVLVPFSGFPMDEILLHLRMMIPL